MKKAGIKKKRKGAHTPLHTKLNLLQNLQEVEEPHTALHTKLNLLQNLQEVEEIAMELTITNS